MSKNKVSPKIGGVYMDKYGHTCTVLLIGKMHKKPAIAISYRKENGETAVSVLQADLWPYLCIGKKPGAVIKLNSKHFIGILENNFNLLRGSLVSLSLNKKNNILIRNAAPLAS